MKATYDKRLQVLEATAQLPKAMRVLYRIISPPDRSLLSFVAEGRSFNRLPGESDEAFEARVLVELGWPDE